MDDWVLVALSSQALVDVDYLDATDYLIFSSSPAIVD